MSGPAGNVSTTLPPTLKRTAEGFAFTYACKQMMAVTQGASQLRSGADIRLSHCLQARGLEQCERGADMAAAHCKLRISLLALTRPKLKAPV